MFSAEDIEKSSKATNGNVSDERDNSIGYGPPSGSSSAIPSLEPPPDNATNTTAIYKLNKNNQDYWNTSEKDTENMTDHDVMKKPDLFEELETNQPLAGACGPLTPGKW